MSDADKNKLTEVGCQNVIPELKCQRLVEFNVVEGDIKSTIANFRESYVVHLKNSHLGSDVIKDVLLGAPENFNTKVADGVLETCIAKFAKFVKN